MEPTITRDMGEEGSVESREEPVNALLKEPPPAFVANFLTFFQFRLAQSTFIPYLFTKQANAYPKQS